MNLMVTIINWPLGQFRFTVAGVVVFVGVNIGIWLGINFHQPEKELLFITPTYSQQTFAKPVTPDLDLRNAD